ncbi:MAG: alkaline phosphatase, partial [Anaerolineales bacterium]
MSRAARKITIALFLCFVGISIFNNAHAQFNRHYAKYIILLIGDGMGSNHIQAANLYTNQIPAYQSWQNTWVSTYPLDGEYNPDLAWQNFSYVSQLKITDSAAAATAMYCGHKTLPGRINVDGENPGNRLESITEIGRSFRYAIGAVTTAPMSDATPAGWIAHNDNRINGFAIADEGLWGNPNTTGTSDETYHAGGHGNTNPPIDVLIGGGHPSWLSKNNHFISEAIVTKLRDEANQPNALRFVERVSGSQDGGSRLLSKASQETTTKLVGLFGGANGDIEFRMADGSGANPENPNLVQMTQAALKVLERNPNGFLLMVEGGTIDHASHANNMDEMVGEVLEFNQAVQAVIDWVNDPNNDSTWENSLLIITADHETGYLTASPSVLPNLPLGEISQRTLGLEKSYNSTSFRASWEDNNANGQIDAGEQVYWAWNSSGHTNSLVPL